MKKIILFIQKLSLTMLLMAYATSLVAQDTTGFINIPKVDFTSPTYNTNAEETEEQDDRDSVEVFLDLGHTLFEEVNISSNKRYVLSKDYSSFKLWDYQSGKLIKTIPRSHNFVKSAITPNGKYIIGLTGREYDIGIMEVSSGNLVGKPLPSAMTSLDPVDRLISRDGTLLAVPKEGKVAVYEISTGKKVQSASIGGVAHQVIFSADGKNIYISKKEGDVFSALYALNIKTGQLKSIYEDKIEDARGLALSGDGKRALSIDDRRRVEFWDLATGKTLEEYRVSGSGGIRHSDFRSLRLSDDGGIAVIGYMDSKYGRTRYRYAIMNNWNGHMYGLYKHPLDKYVTDVKISPNNEYVFLLHSYEDQVIFNVNKEEIKGYSYYGVFENDLSAMPYSILDAVFCKGENAILTYVEEQDFKGLAKVSLDTGEVLSVFGERIEPPSAFIRMPDGKRLLAGRHIWDIETGRLLKSLPQQELKPYQLAAASADGQSIIIINTAEGFNRIREFNLEKLEFTNIYKLPSKVLNSKNRNKYEFKYTPDGKYLVGVPVSHVSTNTGKVEHSIQVWDTQTGNLVQTIEVNTGWIQSFDVSPNGEKVILLTQTMLRNYSYSTKLLLYDIHAGSILKTINPCEHISNCTAFVAGMNPSFSFDGTKIITQLTQTELAIWDLTTGSILQRLDAIGYARSKRNKNRIFLSKGFRRDRSIYGDVFNLRTNKVVNKYEDYTDFQREGFSEYFEKGENGQIVVYDSRTNEKLASSFVFSDGEWITITPEGYYMGSDGGAEHLSVRIGDEVFSMDNFFSTYYRPDIVHAALGGRDVSQLADSDIRTNAELPPSVKFTSPSVGITSAKRSLTLTAEITDRGGGIGEVRLTHNGKTISSDTRGLKLASGQGKIITRKFEVSLLPGENTFELIALSSGQRIESNPARLLVSYEGIVATSDLYVLAVGLNEYKNASLNLNYGRPDAEAFVQAIQTQSTDIFKSVNVTALYDGQATRSSVKAAFEEIISSAKPQDTFLFFYAGHGVMSTPEGNRPGDFYMALHEITQLYGNNSGLATHGISASEMTELSRRIKARKQLIVLDACQSGGAVQTFAMRGAAEQKAIIQLARSAGLVVMASTGTQQYATEFQALGHGVFTYALLGGLSGKADGGSEDGKITVKELAAFINDRVPALTTKHRGQAQFPNSYARGQDFPISIVIN